MRLARTIGIPAAGVVLFLFVLLLGGGWFYSDEIRRGALEIDRSGDDLDLVVSAVGAGKITLDVTDETAEDGRWRLDGVFGLELEGAYAQVGKIAEVTDRQVVRDLIPVDGIPQVGARARIDSFSFQDDPQRAHGLAFNDVKYSNKLGEFPAWRVQGSSDRWAIYVHGHRSSREEALRALPTIAEAGLTSLVIAYRNDEGAPTNPDGFIRFGATEWEDLEGAVQYALDNGAKDVVLVGYSMGGGVVMSFLFESALVSHVQGVILHAPMLDFGQTVDFRAGRSSLPVIGLPVPGVLTDTAKVISNLRFDVDWNAINYLAKTSELSAPILLFHGDADNSVPIETSEQLAQARSDIVEYVRVAGASHVGAWNKDSAAYRAKVSEFLTRIAK